MKVAAWITLLYGLLILAGGIMGHIKTASTISLVMGSIFGIFLLMSSAGMFKNKLFPAYMAIVLTLILDVFFIYRFLLSFKFLPAGLMSIISLVVLLFIIFLIYYHLRRERGDQS